MAGPYVPGAGQNGTSGWLDSGQQPYSNSQWHYEDLIESMLPKPGSGGSSYNGYNSASSVANKSGNWSVSSGFGGGEFDSYYQLLREISRENNQFNLEQTKMVNEFNAQEAQKNRDWQERLSNTAYQRATADMIKAGINPVLAAGGQGAVTGSGAVASGQKAVADNTLGQGVSNMISSYIHAAAQERTAQINAASYIYGANMNAANQSAYRQTLFNNNLMSNITRALYYGLRLIFH